MGLGKPGTAGLTLQQRTISIMHGGIPLVDKSTDMSARRANDGFINVHETRLQALIILSSTIPDYRTPGRVPLRVEKV